MGPRFSVIVPIYNVENYLKKCVDSLISQEFKDVEILLVDDGSPDNCPSICDEYAKIDSRIRVIHKTNGGLVSARQAGCKAAKGQYILNVDGDDWVKSEYFECLNTIIEEYTPDYVCFGAFHVQEGVETPHLCNMKAGYYDLKAIQNNIYPQLIENSTGQYFSPAVWSKAIKRDIYVQCQLAIDTRIKIGEDHACTKPALVKAKSLYIINKCLYCYRINPLSMTKEKRAFSLVVPELIGRHFEAQIDMTCYDFQIQVYRNVVHNLFNAVISQFNRDETYKDIKIDIIRTLNGEYYTKAINNCAYRKKYMVGNICKYLMKYNAIWIIALIYKIKNLK